MNRIIIAAAALALCVAVSGYALSGELVVLSDREAQPNETAGLYYLGKCSAGYIYNGSAASLGQTVPYRVLDEGARGKHYFLLSLPKRTALTTADMETVGAVRRLGDEYLLAAARPGDVGILLAMEPRLRVRELRPTARVRRKAAAETPPAKKNATIEAAINTITAEEYAGYIGKLQSYGTRYSFTAGCEGARNWLRNWYAGQNLNADWHAFECGRYESAYYPEAGGNIYLGDYHCMVRRSRDGGASWDTLRPARATAGPYYTPPTCYWFDSDNGMLAGNDGYFALTADGGDSWRFVRYATPPAGGYINSYGLAFATRNVGWFCYVSYKPAVGEHRYVEKTHFLKTEDGGTTWNKVEWSIPFTVDIAVNDQTHIWAVAYVIGKGRMLYYSDDGGLNWNECSLPLVQYESINDVAAASPRKAWSVTSSGRVLCTTNGTDWLEVDTGFTGDFRYVDFPTPNCGYISANPMIKTEDGGETWTRVDVAPAFECLAMDFADAEHGIISDYYGEDVYLTSDGGASWTDVSGGLNVPEYNVVAERVGTEKPDEIIIIGGHYDSISTDRPWDCPGAEDNASGTACAMVAARAFRNVNFKRTVRFLAFGDEEAYLLGSEAYANECAERGENVVAVLNADMVSYDEENGARDDLLLGVQEEVSWLVDYLNAVDDLYGQQLIYDWERTWVSDDWPFTIVGYPALGLIEGDVGEGGGQEYPWYHTVEDTLDKIQPEFGARCARNMAAMVAHLAGVAGTFPDPPPPGGAAVPFARPFAVYPNPYCYASTTAGVSFVGLRAPATVEIYDLAGRRVTSAAVPATTDEFVWNLGGEALAPGVYLYRVEGQSQKESGKVVIAK